MVMTNTQGGQQLADAVIRSIASVYGWPNFHPMYGKHHTERRP